MDCKKPILFFVIFIVISLTQNAVGQGEFLAKNLAHRYNHRAEVHLKHETISLENRSLVFLKLIIRHNRTRLEDLVTTYAFMDKLSGSMTFSGDTIDLNRYWINNVGNQHYFNLEINNPNRRRILIFRIYNQATDTEYYFDMDVNPRSQILNSGIMVTLPNQNIPYFREYVRSNESFSIIDFKNSDSLHFAFRYTDNFPVASPPFSTNGEEVRKELGIDSSFALSVSDIINLETPGMHLIQYDTNGVNGVTFRSEDEFFPRLGSYDDLIEALVYFSTNSEMEELLEARDKKTAFDRYWLDVTGSANKAKRVIKAYYQRIRRANELFTNYKRGWKTDKGMIYTIFGPPDVVHKDEKKEEWIYERTVELPRLSFEFQRIESIFTHDHYVLIRKKSYQQIWYKAIDLWRKGQKEI